MEDFYLKGKLVEIIPVSVYENKVYTQNIIFELENNNEIKVFDPVKKCKENMKGKKLGIKIHVSTVQPIIKNEEKDMKIVPHSFEYGPYADIYGYIEKITKDKQEYLVALNAGIGKVILYTDEKQIDRFSENDYISIKGARLDLGEIKDVE